jgi:hypothetical protein
MTQALVDRGRSDTCFFHQPTGRSESDDCVPSIMEESTASLRTYI